MIRLRPTGASVVATAVFLVSMGAAFRSAEGAPRGETTRVSVGPDGTQATARSGGIRLSRDGRFAAFWSAATEIVPGDTNGSASDVFVRELRTGVVERVSVSDVGAQSGSGSLEPSLSADGRLVAFSTSGALAPEDGNGVSDVYVRDRSGGRTVRVSVDNEGGDADGASFGPVISEDGTLVAFLSFASDLHPDDADGDCSLFVADTTTRAAEPVAPVPGCTSPNTPVQPSISADGRLLAFGTSSRLDPEDRDGLEDVYVFDLRTRALRRVSSGGGRGPSLSADGRWVAYWRADDGGGVRLPGDTPNEVILTDLHAGATRVISQPGAIASGYPSLATDGTVVAFQSFTQTTSGLRGINAALDINVLDLRTEEMTIASVGHRGRAGSADSLFASVSGDGRLVAFESDASNLVPGDTNLVRDVFVHDRLRRRGTTRASLDGGGGEATGNSFDPAISADGRFVAFASDAATLVAGDTNGATDVFLRDVLDGTTIRVSVADQDGDQAGGRSTAPSVSGDGSRIAFVSTAPLSEDDEDGGEDIYVRDLGTGRTTLVSDVDHGRSTSPSISSDGLCVAYRSEAASGDPASIYLRELDTNELRLVSRPFRGSIASDDSASPSTSADCGAVAFVSEASNLVPGDSNEVADVFVWSRVAGVIERVSVGFGGQADRASGAPSVSGSGDVLLVAFESSATNLVASDTNGVSDVFVWVRPGSGPQADVCEAVRVSGLLPDIRCRGVGPLQRASVGPGPIEADSASFAPTLSGDGRSVAFFSGATNLVAGDTNTSFDVFVHDLESGTTTRVSVDPSGGQANGASADPSSSGDGRLVAFSSVATNLDLDTNDSRDVFVHDRGAPSCPDGGREDGSVSEPVGSDVGPLFGQYAVFFSGASCATLVAAGL